MSNESVMGTQSAKDIRVLVCRVNAAPVVEQLTANKYGKYLPSMQSLVDGELAGVVLENGLELWFNAVARHQLLPVNRVIPAVVAAQPTRYGKAYVGWFDDDIFFRGEPGQWHIRGDFFLARTDAAGELADVTDADIAKYQAMWT